MKLRWSLLFAALCGIALSDLIDEPMNDAGDCEQGWTSLHGKCYIAVSQFASWDTAKDQCEKRGGILAVTKSQQQVDDLLATQTQTGHAAFWMGAKEENGAIKFTDDKPSTYTNWNSPNDKPTAGKSCVKVNKIPFGVRMGSWSAADCSEQYPYTCEKRSVGLGEPTLTYKTPLPNTPGVTMVCNIDYPDNVDATIDVEWYANGQRVKTDRVTGRVRESLLKSGHSFTASENEFKVGDTLQCKVKACKGLGCTPTGTPKPSNDYFVGMKIVPKDFFEYEECSGETIKVKLVPTVPIRCVGDGSVCADLEGEYGVRVDVKHDNKVKVSDCFLDFPASEDPQNSGQEVEIVPICDNINGNGDTVKIQFPDILTNHPFWKGYNPDDVTIKITDKNTPIGQCHCNDDPHCRTLDGRSYDYMGTGTFVMYRSLSGQFEVDIKTRRCNGRASCTCAVAVQYREVVVVLDACAGYMRQELRPAGAKFPKGMRVDRSCRGNGCRMVVWLPNGNSVTFVKNGIWHQLYVKVHRESGECKNEAGPCGGLCGKFNGNSGDDFQMKDGGITNNPNQFGDSWKIADGESYFMKIPNKNPPQPKYPLPERTCNCMANQPDCEYNFNEEFDPIDEEGEDINDELMEPLRRRRSLVSKLLESYSARTKRATITEDEAKAKCHQVVFESQIGKACMKLNNFQAYMTVFKEDCIFDLQASGDWSVVSSTTNTLLETCKFEAISNPLNHVNGKPPTSILDNLCTGDCSGHGTCVKSKCVCEAGWTAPDCGIALDKPPVLVNDQLALCDRRTQKCNYNPVHGSGFLNSDKLKCVMKSTPVMGGASEDHKTLGKQTGALTVHCKLPSHITPILLAMAVSNDDGKSSSQNSAELIVYDSQCQSCDKAKKTCEVLDNMCSIDGKCYVKGDKNPADDRLTCDPAKSQTSWTGPFTFLGCFKDKDNDRALSVMVDSFRNGIKWKEYFQTQMKALIEKCGALARQRSLGYFAIQFYGECWAETTIKGSVSYNKHGTAHGPNSFLEDTTKKYRAGRAGVNCVYKLN